MVSELVVFSSSDSGVSQAEQNRQCLGKQLEGLLHKVSAPHVLCCMLSLLLHVINYNIQPFSDGTMTEITFTCQQQSHPFACSCLCCPLTILCTMCCTLPVHPKPSLQPLTAALSVPNKPESSTVVSKQRTQSSVADLRNFGCPNGMVSVGCSKCRVRRCSPSGWASLAPSSW